MTRSARRVALAAALVAAMLVAWSVPALASPESDLLSKVNSARRAAGKDKLTSLSKLKSAAESHARQMRDKQKIYNSSSIGSIYDGWKSMGQIVGAGPDVNSLFDAFMSSSSHRSTIRGSYNYIGIGAAKDDNGILWVSMIFMNHPDDDLGGGGGSGSDPTTTTTKAPATTTTTTKAPARTTTTTKAPPRTTTTTTEAPDEAVIEDTDDAETAAALVVADTTTTTSTTTTTTTTSTSAPPPETTTTGAAVPLPQDRNTPAGGAPIAAGAPASAEGIPLAVWIAFAVIAVLAIGLGGFATRLRAGTAVSSAAAFDPCHGCGVIYNKNTRPDCPGCGLAPA